MRVKGWEQRLWHVTNDLLGKPFVWGSNDCCLFAADCIQACTDIDHGTEFRGTYSTEREAKRVLAKLDCGDVGDLASRYLPEIKVSLARRGDIVMMTNADGENYLAVVVGHTAVGPTSRGMLHSPKKNATRAWRVE